MPGLLATPLRVFGGLSLRLVELSKSRLLLCSRERLLAPPVAAVPMPVICKRSRESHEISRGSCPCPCPCPCPWPCPPCCLEGRNSRSLSLPVSLSLLVSLFISLSLSCCKLGRLLERGILEPVLPWSVLSKLRSLVLLPTAGLALRAPPTPPPP